MVDKEPKPHIENYDGAETTEERLLGKIAIGESDLMTEKNQIELEMAEANNQKKVANERLERAYERYGKIVGDIADGSMVTVEPSENSQIRVFSIEDGRQVGFVENGGQFSGKKLDRKIFKHITELINQKNYIRLDNSQAAKLWNIVDVEPPEVNE